METRKPNTAQSTFVRRHKTAVVVILLTSITLALAGIFYYLTPGESQVAFNDQPVPAPSVTVDETIQAPIIQINADNVAVDIDPTMVVYENAAELPSITELAENIAAAYSLAKRGATTWDSAQYVLHSSPQTYSLNLTALNQTVFPQNGFNEREAVEQAMSLLQRLGLPTSPPELLTTSAQYFSGTSEAAPISNPQDARLITLTLGQAIAGKLVVLGEHVASSTLVTFTSDFSLTQLAYVPLLRPRPLYQVSTLTKDQAVQNILEGKYSIISNYQESGTPITLTSLESVEVKSGVVEYRYFPDINKLYPYYRFSALGYEISPEFSFAIEIITPAVNTAE